jgi:PAS domain-containing protein
VPEAENGELKTALEQQVNQLTTQLETANSRTESLLLCEQQVEAAIAHTERLTLALDAAKMGWWDLDLATGKSIWNTYHEIIFGYEPGKPERDYFDWEQRTLFRTLPACSAKPSRNPQKIVKSSEDRVAKYRS